MSIKAINWCWSAMRRVKLTPSAGLVLQSLAHCHFEDTGRCDPSISDLQEKTGLSESTVHRAIAELRKKGLIFVTFRKRETGLGRPNMTNRYSFRGGVKLTVGSPQFDTHLKDKGPTPFHSLVEGIDDPDAYCVDGGLPLEELEAKHWSEARDA
jgi:DNA-binding transcriptional MocR family regulator